jgi:hypothetical protein
VQTALGRVSGKIAYLPDGSVGVAPEYEYTYRIAKEQGISLAEAVAVALDVFRSTQGGTNQ